MTTIHLRKPVLLFGVFAASAATLAAETSAQSRPTPERPLSDAVAEVLRSPFHGGHAPSGSPGLVLLPGPAGAAASPAEQLPGARIPAPAGAPSAEDDTPSRGKVFLLATLASAAGAAGSHYLYDRCAILRVRDPVRHPAAPFVRPPAVSGNDDMCPTDDETVLAATGVLAIVTMTGGAAALAGRDFWRSLAGAALGYAAGLAAAVGTILTVEELGWEDAANWVGAGVGVLSHATVTTLLFNRPTTGGAQ